MEILYYGFKTLLVASLVRAFIIAEPLKRQVFWLSVLYTALVAGLSYVFLLSQFEQPNYELWKKWLVVNLVITYIYFKLLTIFDESKLYWIVLPFALVVIFNEPNLVPIWEGVLGGALHSGKRALRGGR